MHDTRDALGEEAFTAAYAAGRLLDWEQMSAFALQDTSN